jgi:hypothetical protein
MRLVCAFKRTEESRARIGRVTDGCHEETNVLAPTADEPLFEHIKSEFDAKVVRRCLRSITCAVQPGKSAVALLSLSSASGFALHIDDDDTADSNLDRVSVSIRDPIAYVSAVGSAGDLFCYVAKIADGTRWCRVFRCSSGQEVRTAAETVVKDALLTARYNAKMIDHNTANAPSQQVYLRQTEERGMQREATSISASADRILRRLERPYLCDPDDAAATTAYLSPPPFTNNRDNEVARADTVVWQTSYDAAPEYDGFDDNEAELASAHAENCKRAMSHVSSTASEQSSATNDRQGAAAGPAVVRSSDDPAVEHARLMQAQALSTKKTPALEVEQDCGCGYGYSCKMCRLRKADEDEVFEGFADEMFETGFGKDEGEREDEYGTEMYLDDNEPEDDDTGMAFPTFHCGCGVPYEEFCRVCDFKARKALEGTPFTPADDSVYEESSFMDDQGVDTLRHANSESATRVVAGMPSALTTPRAGPTSPTNPSENQEQGFVGYLDEQSCTDMLLYVQAGNYIVRQVDSTWYCILVKAPSVDKPVVKIPVRTLEDGRFDCGSRVFYRMADVLDSLRKRPLKSAKSNKDWTADLWLKVPVQTETYVPVQPKIKSKGRRKGSFAQRFSAWVWR